MFVVKKHSLCVEASFGSCPSSHCSFPPLSLLPNLEVSFGIIFSIATHALSCIVYLTKIAIPV